MWIMFSASTRSAPSYPLTLGLVWPNARALECLKHSIHNYSSSACSFRASTASYTHPTLQITYIPAPFGTRLRATFAPGKDRHAHSTPRSLRAFVGGNAPFGAAVRAAVSGQCWAGKRYDLQQCANLLECRTYALRRLRPVSL